MIDFSKYTLQELQAITDALDKMSNDIVEHAFSVGYAFREYYDHASAAVEKKIAEHVRKAEEKLAAQQVRDAAEPAGDPPTPPDMFGWVSDALDDLCAAEEVIGNG